MVLFTDHNDRPSVLPSSSLFSSKLVTRLSRSLLSVLSSSPDTSSSSSQQLQLSLVLLIISTLQSLSLVLVSEDLGGFERVEKAFRGLQYVRGDALAVELDWNQHFWYALQGTIYGTAGLLGGNVTFVLYRKRKPPSYLLKATKALLALLRACLIPALVLQISHFKYTFLVQAVSMSEYSASIPPFRSQFQALVSLFSIVLLFGLLYLHTYFYPAHFRTRSRYVESRSESGTLRLELIARFSSAFAYCLIRDWSPVCLLLLSCSLLIQQWKRLPCYNAVLTVGYASREAVLVWAVVCYEVGRAVDSAGTVLLLLCFAPLLVRLVSDFFKWEMERINGYKVAQLSSLYHMEIRLRTYFEQLEHKTDSEPSIHTSIEQLFQLAYERFPRNPFIPLWEGSYYCYYCHNPTLSLLKLTQITPSFLSFDTHVWLQSSLDRYEAISAAPEQLYLRHLQLLDRAKRADERCCLHLQSFCDILLRKKADTGRVVRATKRLACCVKETVKKYLKVLKGCGNEEETMGLYGSFLSDIAGEEEGQKIAQRMERSRNHWDQLKAGNGGYRGLIGVECSEDQKGLIVQATALTYVYLHCTPFDLIRQSIADFLPAPFRPLLPSLLSRLHTLNLSGQELPCLFRLLQDCEGYLVPVSTTVKLTTWGNVPYLLLFLTLEEGVEMALVDGDSVIQAHSRLVGIVAVAGVRYNGQRTDIVFPGLSMRKGNFLYTTSLGTSLSVTISYLRLSSLSFKLITFHTAAEGFTRENSPMGDRHNEGFILSDMKTSSGPRALESKEDGLMTTTHQLEEVWHERLKLSIGAESSNEARDLGRKQLRLKLFLLLSFVVVVCGHIACVVFVTQLLKSVNLITTIHRYSHRNADIINLAYDARSLMLTDLSFPYDLADLSRRLVNTSAAIKDVTEAMKNTIGYNAKLDSYLTEAKVPIWRLLNSKPDLTLKSLLDALYDYTQAATALAVSASPYSLLPQAFFLARNGAGELLEVANRTLYLEVKEEEMERVEALEVLPMLVMVCLVLMALSLLLLVVPQLYGFEKENREVWSRLYGASREAVLKSREMAITRLQTYFHYGEFEAASLSVSQTKPQLPKLWPSFLLRLCVFLLLNGLFFLILILVTFQPLNSLALTIPNYVFLMNMRADIAQEGQFWTREWLLAGQMPLSPAATLWSRPSDRVSNATSTMAFIGKALLAGDSNYGLNDVWKSNSYLNYAYFSACDGDCPVLEASLGFRYVLKNWEESLRAFVSPSSLPQYSTIKAGFEALESLEPLTAAAVKYCLESADFYTEDAQNRINDLSRSIVGLTSAFIVTVFLLYFAFYWPGLNAQRDRSLEALSVCKHIRAS